MASQTNEALFLMGDEFVADEILARLPARHAVRCVLLSNRFRELLTLPHFYRRLGAHSELPRAACLYLLDKRFYFHAVGPTFAIKHTVSLDRGTYAGTCDGLVLLADNSAHSNGRSAVDGVVFNPTTKEEVRFSLPLPHAGEDVDRRFLGFGYGPSSKAYKALVYEGRPRQHGCRAQLMVVPLDGAAAGCREPRTVFSSDYELLCDHSLHMGDGKVYFLMYRWYFDCVEDIAEEQCDVTSVLIFDVDTEAITSVAVPEEHISFSMMLDINGRPCIYKKKDQETVVWLLTPDHRWERMRLHVQQGSQWDDDLLGTWDCGGGLLFAKFRNTGAYLYNLRKPDERGEDGRLVPMSSMEIEHGTPEPLEGVFVPASVKLWDYQPTLISPASIFRGAKFPGRRESFTLHNELEEVLLEVTRKVIVDQAMRMLSMAGAPLPAEVTHTMAITDAGRQQADQEEKTGAKDTK